MPKKFAIRDEILGADVHVWIVSVVGCAGDAPPAADPSGTVDAPALVLELAPETFRFRWEPADPDVTGRFLVEQVDADAAPVRIIDLDVAATLAELEVPLLQRLDAQYQLETCRQQTCVRSPPVGLPEDLSDVRGAVLGPPPDAARTTDFGRSIAISADGATLAVGAPGSGATPGVVHTHRRVSGGWRADLTVRAPSVPDRSGARFGHHVALDGPGTTLAVDGAPVDHACLTVAPRVFVRRDRTWVLDLDVAEVLPGHDMTRADLSEDGQTLVVTGRQWDPECRSEAWSWWELTHESGSWRVAHEEPLGEDHPVGIAVSGDGEVVTMRLDPSTFRNESTVGVWERNGSDWSRTATLRPSPDRFAVGFGDAIDVDQGGTRIVVADPRDHAADDRSDPGGGSVTVFFRATTGAWSREAVLTHQDGPFTDFGAALSLDGTGQWLAVGGPEAWSPRGQLPVDGEPDEGWIQGAVWVFARDAADWDLRTVIRTPVEDVGRLSMGEAVAFDGVGDTLVVPERRRAQVDTGIWSGSETVVPGSSVVWLY